MSCKRCRVTGCWLSLPKRLARRGAELKESSHIMAKQSWYSVRSAFRVDLTHNGKARRAFEERVVLFRAASFDEALAKGEAETKRYAAFLQTGTLLDHIVAYHIHDDELVEGDEVWSCMRGLETTDEEFMRRIYEGEFVSVSNTSLQTTDA